MPITKELLEQVVEAMPKEWGAKMYGDIMIFEYEGHDTHLGPYASDVVQGNAIIALAEWIRDHTGSYGLNGVRNLLVGGDTFYVIDGYWWQTQCDTLTEAVIRAFLSVAGGQKA